MSIEKGRPSFFHSRFSFQDTLTQKIMDEPVRWQKAKAKEGSENGGRPKKKINFDIVKKQLSAGAVYCNSCIAKGE